MPGPAPRQNGVYAAPGEGQDCLVSADLAELAHGSGCQIVVGVLKLGPPGRGQPVAFGRPTAADLLPSRGRVSLRVAALDQRIKMSAHPGGGNAESTADLGSGDRTRFQQQPHDDAPGLAVLTRDTA